MAIAANISRTQHLQYGELSSNALAQEPDPATSLAVDKPDGLEIKLLMLAFAGQARYCKLVEILKGCELNQDITSITAGAETIDLPAAGEPEQLLYVLSSSLGFGHASRAVAVAQELPGDTEATFAAHPNAHHFIRDNVLGAQLAPLDYTPSMSEAEFAQRNPYLFELLARSSVIINDFLVQLPIF